MIFNADKCSHLTITNKKNPIDHTYTINGKSLGKVKQHPYLGLELNQTLSWKDHVDNTAKKAQRSLNLLRRNISTCSKATKEAAYKTLVRPSLEYASPVWDPYIGKHIGKLEGVQRKAARFVTANYSREASVTDMVKNLEWRSLQERRFIARQTMLYKALNAKAACPIPPHFPPSPPQHRTSHDQLRNMPRCHLETYKYSFFPRTIRIWNILPASLVQATTPEIFKSALQKQFLEGKIHVVPPRGLFDRPRLGSTGRVVGIGPVY